MPALKPLLGWLGFMQGCTSPAATHVSMVASNPHCGNDPNTNTSVVLHLPAGALKKLTLHGNQLQQIAQEIGQLTNLRELHLQGNLLSELPNELCHLTVSAVHCLPCEVCHMISVTWVRR